NDQPRVLDGAFEVLLGGVDGTTLQGILHGAALEVVADDAQIWQLGLLQGEPHRAADESHADNGYLLVRHARPRPPETTPASRRRLRHTIAPPGCLRVTDGRSATRRPFGTPFDVPMRAFSLDSGRIWQRRPCQ